MRSSLPLRLIMALSTLGPKTAFGTCARPKAVVYRGPASSPGCPESVAKLLESSPSSFEVVFAGPDEAIEIPEALRDAKLYAHGGGPDLDEAYRLTKKYKNAIRKFVDSGGHYLGFCLGAYLAGPEHGYGLLSEGAETSQEIEQDDAQVKTEADTVIQVDWTFRSGRVEKNRWAYFQDGVVVQGLHANGPGRIIGRYSANGDVAASISPYGKGWVGLVGPHPEADDEWCLFPFSTSFRSVSLTPFDTQTQMRTSQIQTGSDLILGMTLLKQR